MKQVITAKYRIYTDDATPFREVSEAYRDACNFISEYIFAKGEDDVPPFRDLHDGLYPRLRTEFRLKAQMAQSAMRTVLARYSTLLTQISESERKAEQWDTRKAELEAMGRRPRTKRPDVTTWRPIRFHNLQCDLVSGRDWSIITPSGDGNGTISLNTLGKRIRCQYTDKGYEKHRGCRRGTAKLVIRSDGKVFLHVSMEREVPDVPEGVPDTVVGVDRGLRFHAVTYDGKRTRFHSGREEARVRARYKATRQSLQKRGTPSSRRRLRRIGDRENRWMEERNSIIAKTLVSELNPGSTIVMEDLSGVRSATEVVRHRDRYLMVSWPYYDLQKKIEYKAAEKGIRVVYVDPRHTSQRCPRCGNVDRNARHRRGHEYVCPKCGFRTNDDRAAAMNIRERGMEMLRYNEARRAKSPAARGCSQPPRDVTPPVCPPVPAGSETAGIKAGRPIASVAGTCGQSQTPMALPRG